MKKREEILETIRRDPFLCGMLSCYERAALCMKGKRVLDYGCGYGWGSWILSAQAHKVVGYDPDKERIDFAREIFSAPNISFFSSQLGVQEGLYDAVCLFMVLPYAEEKKGILKKAAARVKPGGCLWVSYKTAAPELTEVLAEWRRESQWRLGCREERYLSEAENIVTLVYYDSPLHEGLL